MNINDQIFYKAELLTKGMRASDNAKAMETHVSASTYLTGPSPVKYCRRD